MDITIRAEKVSDYNKLANLNYNSFVNWKKDEYKSEPLIVAVLRHSQYFDPDLSVVAEIGNKIVGHAFFSPFEFIVLGEKKRGVFLAPLCVDKDFQNKGIGGMLLEAGHEIARRKGYSISLLCGHDNYYPKFGYLNRMFALTGSKLYIGEDIINNFNFEERPVLDSDLPQIIEKWNTVHKNDKLSLFPGTEISQWFNHSLMYRSSVISLNNEFIGYIKYRISYPTDIKEFFVKDEYSVYVLKYILQKLYNKCEGEFIFTYSYDFMLQILKGFDTIKIKPYIYASNSLMLKILDQNDDCLKSYCSLAKQDDKNLGVISFPSVLDIDN
jgi:predicted N-acetyltransferase YhbS